MSVCYDCGGEITFRYRNGVLTPIHLSGGCNCDSTSFNSNSYTKVEKEQCEINQAYQASYTSKDFCHLTKCPACKEDVFFIRHNGGSVWVDELGWPWPKHRCMDDSSGWQDLNIIGKADIEDKAYGLCTQIRIIENEEAGFSTYIDILYSDNKEEKLLVEGVANLLLGKVVAIGSRKNNLLIYSPESITYKIVNNRTQLTMKNKVISFKKTTPPPPKKEPTKSYKPEDYPLVTVNDLTSFDYRGVHSEVRKNPELNKLYLKGSVDVAHVALGALIAHRFKQDERAASELSRVFCEKVQRREDTCRLIHIPEYTLGYVWSYNNWLLLNARTAILANKK